MSKGILSWQSKFNKFFEMYLLVRYNVPHFSTEKEYVIILKMANLKMKKSKNRDSFSW